ncbi:PAS domain-containing protein, partial [Bacillus cereus]|uniref:PAS domain-containing protein n=1 Tax=Bacillus cereus TaxID=1396 RepID=UPI00345BA46C
SHFDPTDLLDALSTGIVMLDAQLCAIYANVAAQDLLAFSVNKARGRPFADFLGDTNGLNGILRRALETGEGIADRELVV